MIVCLPKVSKRPYRFIFIESFPFVCRCYHNPRLRGCGSGRLAGRRPPRRLWSSSTKSSLNCFQRRTTVTSMMYYYLLRNYFLRTSSRKDYLIHDDVLETKHLLQTCYPLEDKIMQRLCVLCRDSRVLHLENKLHAWNAWIIYRI